MIPSISRDTTDEIGPPNTTVNGHRAVRKTGQGTEILVVQDLEGMDVAVRTQMLGKDGPERILRQLTLLDPDPAKWTTAPTG